MQPERKLTKGLLLENQEHSVDELVVLEKVVDNVEGLEPLFLQS